MPTAVRRTARSRQFPSAHQPGRILPEHEWLPSASCRVVDPELFFPSGRETASRADEEAAKRICRGCPVREPCLAVAIRGQEQIGVWGGMTTAERRRLAVEARRLQTLGQEEAGRLLAGEAVPVAATSRPAVVFHLVSAGWQEAAIADAMGLSPDSVRTLRNTAENAAAFRHLVPAVDEEDEAESFGAAA
ncbi:WhiB family transcriptional regulator [Kitasatospora sp. NPDC093102]|uniref:WhiB family transcriptional regulator n=1 Tax=Kitasatospora sp. NPDC093102 TaxID=3155069 RepID=UPI00342A47CF